MDRLQMFSQIIKEHKDMFLSDPCGCSSAVGKRSIIEAICGSCVPSEISILPPKKTKNKGSGRRIKGPRRLLLKKPSLAVLPNQPAAGSDLQIAPPFLLQIHHVPPPQHNYQIAVLGPPDDHPDAAPSSEQPSKGHKASLPHYHPEASPVEAHEVVPQQELRTSHRPPRSVSQQNWIHLSWISWYCVQANLVHQRTVEVRAFSKTTIPTKSE
nr:protein FAR1-RELATED SEQUENCE 5-like [Ipomoea batatas]